MQFTNALWTFKKKIFFYIRFKGKKGQILEISHIDCTGFVITNYDHSKSLLFWYSQDH